eukprot:COSAG06_NODE_27792_length_586_cov_1.166324_1_plen_62_part_00
MYSKYYERLEASTGKLIQTTVCVCRRLRVTDAAGAVHTLGGPGGEGSLVLPLQRVLLHVVE